MVRAITQADVSRILRMLDTAWRVYLRLSPLELRARLSDLPGFLAEDGAGLRGFMVIEPYPPDVAFLLAAGLRDTWHPKPFFDLLLPRLEQAARAQNLLKLVYIGSAVWLVEELKQRGFETQEWVVTLERSGRNWPPELMPPGPAQLRTVTQQDLPAISALDAVTFNQVWHYAIGNIADALVKQGSFVLAELNDRVVGYIWCEIYGTHAHLSRLAVQPDYQGLGIGTQLLHQAISDALNNGIDHITLNTQEHNLRSLALYRRFDFQTTSQRMPLLSKEL